MKKVMVFLLLQLSFSVMLWAENEKIGVFDLRYTLETDLKTVSGLNTAWDDVHAVSTLQGIVNRNSPHLYVYFVKYEQYDIDKYWWDKYSKEGEWLHGRETVIYSSLEELFEAYSSYIKGVVVYDEKVLSTSNVASSVAGMEDLIAVRYDPTPGSLYYRLVLNGPKLEVKRRLINEDGTSLFTGKGIIPGTNRPSSGSLKNDPYLWFIENYVKPGKCNTEFGAYYLDQYWKKNPYAAVRNHHTLTNHDFFVSKKAFFFDLSPWGDEPATDEPGQPVGTDLATLKEFLLSAYQQNKGEKMCYIGGFPAWAYKYTKHAGGIHDDVPTEWEFGRIISAYNAFKDADAISIGALANASFWQHFPLEENYPQQWVTHEELKKRGLLTEEGKVNFAGRNFIIFYVGDYDASAWVSQFTPAIWDDPYRGKVPLMWCISPVLQNRVPHVLHNFRKTATENDYFVSADNGAGYLMPGMLQEPRPISGLPSGLDAWARHCKSYYDKWGLTITGFIVDGYAPGLNEDGLDCYTSFSPNGIVPQKVPVVSIHRNMPVLRSDLDVNNNSPVEAAKVIVDRVKERYPMRFHWFRNIVKTPTWYMRTVEEIKKRDENILLLDAPSFFELLRIYLNDESQSPFAGGKGTEEDPYLIETPEQFDAMRAYKDKCFKLIADLDFTNYEYNDKQGWWPLGEWGGGDKDAARFSGTFDGDFHTVKNLKAERKAHDLSIFGVTDGAKIRNLIVENCEITGEGRLGVVSGATFRSTLMRLAVINSNCYNTLSDHGSQAGGITGPLFNSELSDCYSVGGSVYAKDGVGGIASFCHAGSRVAGCYSVCRVEGNTNTGGITGGADGAVLENNLALNESITGKTADYGRISGSVRGGAGCRNNYAYEAVTINGEMITGNTGINTLHGENADRAQVVSLDFYLNKLHFDPRLWHIDTDVSPYPIFTSQSGNPTGIQDKKNNNKRHILHRVSDGVMIGNLEGEKLISVYSVTGILLFRRAVKNAVEKIVLNEPGMYVLHIGSDDRAVSYKFIK